MSVKIKLLVSAFIFTNSFSPVMAAENTERVIVTATRTAQTFDDTLAPVIVIDRATLARNPSAELTDLLRMHAGIEIARDGGPGQRSSIFIRGAESNHTLVMIDGVKINPGTIGAAAIQNISPEMIERIEIVKGPRSTLFGSDAIGGVINIITKRAGDTTNYTAALGGGSFNTRELNLGAHHGQGNKGAGINITARGSDGFPTRTTSTIDRGYDNLNAQLYGRMRRGDTDFDISYWHSEGNVEYLDFFLNPLDQDFRNTTAALSAKTVLGSAWVSTLKLSHATDEIDQTQGADYANTARYALDWQNDVQLNDFNLFSSGLYLSDEHTKSSSFGTIFDEDTFVGAVFAQNQFQYQAHQLVVGARFTDHETFGDKTTWSLEYGLAITDNIKVILAGNTGFRAPDATDRFGFGGNPNLRPESSENYEVGLRYTPAPQHRFHLNAFHNTIDDLAEYNLNTSMMENIGRARIEGVEAGYTWHTLPWHIKVEAIYQDPQNLENNTQLLRRAKQGYAASIGYTATDWSISLDARYQGQRRDTSSTTLDAYTLLNLSGQYQLGKSLSISARIENLTDQEYALVSGYNTPERSAYLELRYAN